MTKEQELKILEQIGKLIDSAGEDTYIHDTFAGVVEICKMNIVHDFGDHPVEDLEIERKKNEDAGKMILRLEHENDALSGTITAKNSEIEKLGHLLDAKTAECEKWKDESDAMADCLEGSNMMIDQAEAEIQKLKAEIVRMRLERMTEEQVAELYDKTEGVEKNA